MHLIWPTQCFNRVNLDCSGNGADVSSVSFIGSPIANATFNYYSGDVEVDSDEVITVWKIQMNYGFNIKNTHVYPHGYLKKSIPVLWGHN